VPVLGLIVFVHELGHLIAARMVGVKVTVFSLGFGQRLFGFQRGDTDYRVSLLPLGGYVKMAGDNLEEERSGDPDEFLSRNWYERAFIAVAGPAANFVMATVCAVLIFYLGVHYPLYPPTVGPVAEGGAIAELGLAQGDRVLEVGGETVTYMEDIQQGLSRAIDEKTPIDLLVVRAGADTAPAVVPLTVLDAESLATNLVPNFPAIVGQVTVGTPAYQSGLREGDRFIEVAGVAIDSWWDLVDQISARPNEEIEIVVVRGDQTIRRMVTPANESGDGRIGIAHQYFGTGIRKHGLGESVGLGWGHVTGLSVRFVQGLGTWAGSIFDEPKNIGSGLAGPISIVKMSADQAGRNRTDLLNWLVLISIALMVMNLLPIPVLDGGHILVAFIEGIMRRPLGPRFMMALWRMGMVFLLLLMTFAIANDGLKLVQRTRANHEIEAAEQEAMGDVQKTP
jgi:regulator of sigma E protease